MKKFKLTIQSFWLFILLPMYLSAQVVTDTTFFDDFTGAQINPQYYSVEFGTMQLVNDKLVVTPNSGQRAVLTIDYGLEAPPFGSENPYASELIRIKLIPYAESFTGTDEFDMKAYGANNNLVEKYSFNTDDSTITLYTGDGNSGSVANDFSRFIPGDDIEIVSAPACRRTVAAYEGRRCAYGFAIIPDLFVIAARWRIFSSTPFISDNDNLSPHMESIKITSSVKFEIDLFEAKTSFIDVENDISNIVNMVNQPKFIESNNRANIIIKNIDDEDLFDLGVDYKVFVDEVETQIINLSSSEMEISAPPGLIDYNDIEVRWITIENDDTTVFSNTINNAVYYYNDTNVPVHFLNNILIDGEEEERYEDFLQTDGGNGTISFAILDGSLPSGLTLDNETGEISGIPTSSGLYAFFANVSDDNYNETSIFFIDIEDGFKKMSSIDLNNLKDEIRMNFFPNPSFEFITIELTNFENFNDKYSLNIYSVEGRLLNKHIKIEQQITSISTSELAPGTYYIVLNKNDKIEQSFKFIKN